ncbi:MAG: hypothetical protein KBC48_01040 [Candidatus Pacebacteria bacterium]|nr:hypothetical protein [Candidatus Paceibacterota bacterium]
METNEKKTLQHLNSKVWYRLLKVVFGLCVLLVLGIYNFIIISDGVKNIDNDKTVIFCTYGDKKILTPNKIGIELSNYEFRNGFDYKNFFEGYNDYTIKSIFKSCYPQSNDDIDIFAAQRVYEVVGHDNLMIREEGRPPLTDDQKKYLDEIIPKIEGNYININKSKYLDYSIKLFDIKPSYTYIEFIKYFVLGNLLILFFFEVLRRVFYYILVGSIKPKK